MNVKMSQVLAGSVLMMICGMIQATDEAKPDVEAVGPVVGDPLPEFESTDEHGLAWKSDDHVGKKVLVLYFYPGDFTGGCIKQAEAYREGLAKLEELGVELVGVSADEVASHKLFKETFGMKHVLLADTRGDLAKLLGVPASAGGRVQAITRDRKPVLDAEGNRILLQRSLSLARWTIVVGRDGKIAAVRKIVNPVTDSEEVRKIVEGLST
jgi:peroxiredoxin Q/BCP